MKLKEVIINIAGIKDLLYTKVLWVSPNRKWVLYVNEDYNRIMLEDVINGEGQFPIMDDAGLVAYDNPFLVPKYVRKNVARCLRKYNNIKY